MELIGVDHADLISLLLNNRQKIVYTLRWRQAQEAEKEALERAIRSDATIDGAALLRALEGSHAKSAKSAKDVLARGGPNRPKAQPEKEEEAQLIEEERQGLRMEAPVPKPRAHINLADLEFAAGNHLMSKKTFKLPEGTHKILNPGWEEVHVPAAANKYSDAAFLNSHHLVAVEEMPAWFRKGFEGVSKLNLVQSRVYECAMLSSVRCGRKR